MFKDKYLKAFYFLYIFILTLVKKFLASIIYLILIKLKIKINSLKISSFSISLLSLDLLILDSLNLSTNILFKFIKASLFYILIS